MAVMASSDTTGAPSPRPRSGSAIARWRMSSRWGCSRGWSTTTFERESSAALTSNDGFSVVAPMSTMSPASTRGRKASCCALLKRWISSTKTIVRCPLDRRRSSAAVMTILMSLMPAITALKGTNRARVASAMMRASVVLPVPGGPQRTSEWSRSRSTASRSGVPGPRSASWPTSSSSVRGRIRSASGVPAADRVPRSSREVSESSKSRPSVIRVVAARRTPEWRPRWRR